jgi:hypothetical protein
MVDFFRCGSCGFVQTEEPRWLEEAYSDAINVFDMGIMERNIRLSRLCGPFLSVFFNANQRFLDYGGGYGIFTRLMRDAGFDFYHYDKLCVNLLARGFEHDVANSIGYEAVTAFEVFEHLVEPMDDILEILKFSDNIFFTTELIYESPPPLDNWWYYGTEHGQHISFYTKRTLETVARRLALQFYTDGKSFHLLTRKRLSSAVFQLMSNRRISTGLNLLLRKKSLLFEDYKKATGKVLAAG